MKFSDIINSDKINYLKAHADETIYDKLQEWEFYASISLNGIIACGWFINDDIMVISSDGVFIYDTVSSEIRDENYEEIFQKNISKDNINYFHQKRGESLPIFGLRGGNGNLLTGDGTWKIDIINISYYQNVPKLTNYRTGNYAFLKLNKCTYEDILFCGFSKSENYFLIMGNNGIDIYNKNR